MCRHQSTVVNLERMFFFEFVLLLLLNRVSSAKYKFLNTITWCWSEDILIYPLLKLEAAALIMVLSSMVVYLIEAHCSLLRWQEGLIVHTEKY